MTFIQKFRSYLNAKEAPYRLFGAGYLLLLSVTWRLWVPQSQYPQVPLVFMADSCPAFVEVILLALLILSLGLITFGACWMLATPACLISGVCTFGLVLIDQHRLQPWAWQFVILSVILATAADKTVRSTWRWLVIGIYLWSAWSKLDVVFASEHGRFLLDGLCRSVGLASGTTRWPASMRTIVVTAIPIGELLVAVCLIWQRSRFLGLIGSTLMHGCLLMALGPLGHNHQPGVLAWNLFFIVQNWILFFPWSIESSNDQDVPVPRTAQFGNRFALAVVSLALLWPSLESFGFCDHWPAWAVYAARPERVTISLDSDGVSRLPEDLRRYVEWGFADEEWAAFRIDRWSLDSLGVPVYPQDRFQVGVALGLVDRFQLTTIRVVISASAERWTGRREVADYTGIEAIRRLSDTYRCGARPRKVDQ